MTSLLSECIYPNTAPIRSRQTVPPPNPINDLLEMIGRHTGYEVCLPAKRNGYWEVESIFGRIRVSDLLKTQKGRSIH